MIITATLLLRRFEYLPSNLVVGAAMHLLHPSLPFISETSPRTQVVHVSAPNKSDVQLDGSQSMQEVRPWPIKVNNRVNSQLSNKL